MNICGACGSELKALFTSFYCQACENKANDTERGPIPGHIAYAFNAFFRKVADKYEGPVLATFDEAKEKTEFKNGFYTLKIRVEEVISEFGSVTHIFGDNRGSVRGTVLEVNSR